MFQDAWEVAVGDLSLQISCLIVHEGDCSHGLVTTMRYSHQNLVVDLMFSMFGNFQSSDFKWAGLFTWCGDNNKPMLESPLGLIGK